METYDVSFRSNFAQLFPFSGAGKLYFELSWQVTAGGNGIIVD
jgi:hypothetical protein